MLFSLIFFAVILILYSFGVSPYVQGADSGDIVLSYYFAGVPHPPGYPLNTMLGWLFTRLPISEVFAYRANYLPVLYMALTLTFILNILLKLTRNKPLSVLGALILGFTPLVWFYAHNAEVFQLNLVLVSASLYFLVSWTEKKTQKNISKDAFLTFLFFGLAVFQHQTSLLLIPAYAFFLLKKKKIPLKGLRENLKLFGAFLMGATPYLFIPFAAWRKTPLNWDDASNLFGFIQLITRADYGTFTASSDLVGFSLNARMLQIYWYFKVAFADFTWVGFLLITLGFFYLAFKNRSLLIFLALASFIAGPFFLFYASFPLDNSFLMGVSERFLLLSYPFLTIIMVFGALLLLNTCVAVSKKISTKTDLITLIISLSLLLFPFALFLSNFTKADLSKADLASLISKDVLQSADPPGLIFLRGDTITVGVLYEYYVNKTNRFVVPLMSGRLRHLSYRKELPRLFPALSFPDNFTNSKDTAHSTAITGLIEANYGKYPIYSLQDFPLDKRQYVWVTEGILLRLYKHADLPDKKLIRERIVGKLASLEFNKRENRDDYIHLFDDEVIETYASVYASNAKELFKIGYMDDSLQYFEKALVIQPDLPSALIGIASIKIASKNCDQAQVYAKRVIDKNPKLITGFETMADVYDKCYGDKSLADDYRKKAQSLKPHTAEINLDQL